MQKGGMMKPICPPETPMDGDFSLLLKIILFCDHVETIGS